MATFNLPFSLNRYRAMLDDEISDYEFIEQVMLLEKDAKNAVCFQLWQNYTGEGAPSCDEFEITEVNFDKYHRSGSIEVEFVVHFFFGCDGMDNSSELMETIDFKLDLSTRLISFTISDKIVRDTVDEF